MHIYEGILAATPTGQAVLLGGAVAAAAGTAIGLWRLEPRRIPQTAVLTAAFFVVSAIHVPLFGVTAEHLTLTGLMGLLLGWSAFPAVLVGLTLQIVFLSLGGPTVLGLNTLIMALPAVVCYYLFRRPLRSANEKTVFAAGFAAGSVAIVLATLLNAGSLLLAGQQFELASKVVLLGHLPLAIIEGFVTGSAVVLFRKVAPELLDAPAWTSAWKEAEHV